MPTPQTNPLWLVGGLALGVVLCAIGAKSYIALRSLLLGKTPVDNLPRGRVGFLTAGTFAPFVSAAFVFFGVMLESFGEENALLDGILTGMIFGAPLGAAMGAFAIYDLQFQAVVGWLRKNSSRPSDSSDMQSN